MRAKYRNLWGGRYKGSFYPLAACSPQSSQVGKGPEKGSLMAQARGREQQPLWERHTTSPKSFPMGKKSLNYVCTWGKVYTAEAQPLLGCC